MYRRIVRAVSAAAIVALLLPAVAGAQTGFGVRAGSFTLNGDNIDMDAEATYGVHLSLGFIPVLKFQLGAEYTSGTADYDFGGIYTLADEDYKGVSVFADVRYPIKLIPMFPIKPVVGGGINMNALSYFDESQVMAIIDGGLTGDQDPDSFTNFGYHLMAGLMFDPPVLPFTITFEYRYQSISLENETISSTGFLVGVTFGF
jgi:opacity protein-like surface antigen